LWMSAKSMFSRSAMAVTLKKELPGFNIII
jgi:hypothetical protein